MAYSIQEAKDLVIKAGHELLETGLIARTWGNISARVSDTHFVITPSGKAYDSLTPDDIVLVKISDCSYEGDVKPSSEKGVHAEGYKLRKDANFIVHTHQNNASALSIIGRKIKDIESYGRENAELLGPVIPTAVYGLSSTKTLKNNVAKAISDNPLANTVLMRYHGAVCLGKDYDNAFDIAHALEYVTGRCYEKYVGERVRTVDDTGKCYTWCDEVQVRRFREYCRDDSIGAVVRTETPYVKIMSGYGQDMKPYIDDLAQIAGTLIRCLPADYSEAQIKNAMNGRAAALVTGNGAICVGKNKDEAEAVCMVLEKGAQAAFLARFAGNIPPIGGLSTAIERKVYVMKYSKLK
ncbi:MAG: class II aldolase/adducin family protein [Lachnospiraceae bacterium]|nr:class II aldolase/adducin family protein [Lachnospiraceae bacterium]